jgi:hypothetical protein
MPKVYEFRVLFIAPDVDKAGEVFDLIVDKMERLVDPDDFEALLLDGFTEDTVEIMEQGRDEG